MYVTISRMEPFPGGMPFFSTLRRQLAFHMRLLGPFCCAKEKTLQPFLGHSHFLHCVAFLFLQHKEGSWQNTPVSFGHFKVLVCLVVEKKEKRCNHFQDTAISWRDTIFSFCNTEKAAGKLHGSLLVILQAPGLLCAKEERCNHFQGTAISEGYHFFFLTLRRQPANYMGLYWSFCLGLLCC